MGDPTFTVPTHVPNCRRVILGNVIPAFSFLIYLLFLLEASVVYGTDMISEIKAGAATRVVNPAKPAVPSGHGSRTRVPPEKIYSDLCTQALVLEDASGSRIVLITGDFMMLTAELADRIREIIKEKYGIPPEAVCVHVTHNHASPPIAEREAIAKEYFDPEYGQFFVNQTVGAVTDALAKLIPVKLRYCEDVCTSVAINRRGKDPETGAIGNFPNNKGAVDFKVRVVTAESLTDGKPIVVLVEYAAHPVVTTSDYLGGEYPAAIRKWMQVKYPGATAMYFQGCAGNIRIQVLNEDRNRWIKGDPTMAERFGHDLADAVERAMTKPGDPIVGPIEYVYAVIPAPLQRETDPKTTPLRVQVFRFGPRSKTPFIFIGLGAEAFIEYGLQLEQRLRPANSIVVGYANDLAGYLPTAQACREGGYEPNAWDETSYDLPGPYSPDAEVFILDAVEKLAKPRKQL